MIEKSPLQIALALLSLLPLLPLLPLLLIRLIRHRRIKWVSRAVGWTRCAFPLAQQRIPDVF